jgi:hypothetical protein
MNELRDALERLADRADDATSLPSPPAIRSAGERRTRRTSAGVAAVAVAAVVVVVVALTRPGPDRGDSVPAVDRTGTPTAPSARALSPTAWETLEPNWGVERLALTAVAARGPTFVVVADTSRPGEPAGTPIWWSTDGRAWTRASGITSVNVTDVVATESGFVATGIDQDGAAAFRSDDGRTWEQVLDPPRSSSYDALWGAASTSRGLYVTGIVGEERPAIYRSGDGRSWIRTDLRAPAGRGSDTFICDVRDAPGGGVIATGEVREDGIGSDAGYVATWTSPDGVRWSAAERTPDNPLTRCNDLAASHRIATTEAGAVRVDPFSASPETLSFRGPR